ncbi:MAG: histidine kinase, partial [Methylotenera sp.]
MKVATGLAIGSKANAELAAQAVLSAMSKAELDAPACVLLFLSSEFASNPQPAIKAAAKASSCTNIIGCSAIGIYTEEDWVIDSPAAAAMVFSDNIWLKPEQRAEKTVDEALLLTLAAPNAINSSWLNTGGQRLGGVSGDAIGHGAFSVWENAKGITQGYCEMHLDNMQFAVGATHGLRLLTSPRRITACNQLDLLTIANLPAFNALSSACKKEALIELDDEIPYHQLMVVYASRA